MIVIKGLGFRKGWAITLFPFILVSDKTIGATLLHHEKIHIRQQLECLLIVFYLWYGIEWCIHFIKVKNIHQAYRMISFEKEAYDKESDADYLKNRKLWAFIKWL